MNIKSFGTTTLIYAFGNIGLRSVSFLTLPMYTHFLSIREYGMLATLLITMQPLVVFMNLGMRIGLMRFMTEFESENKTNTLLGTTTAMNVIGGLIVTAILMAFCLPLFRKILQSGPITDIILLTCAGSFAQSVCIHLSTFYRARNMPFRFLFSSLMAAIFTCTFTYVLTGTWHLGIDGALISITAGYAVVAVLILADLLLETGPGFSYDLVPKLLRFSLPLIISASGHFIIWGTSVYFLSYFASLEVVAIYSLGYKLAQLLSIIVILPFQLSFQPFIFSQFNSIYISRAASRLFTYLLLSLGFVSFILLLGIRILLPYIAPPEYASAFEVVIILLPGVASIGLYYFGETILGAVNKTATLAVFMSVFALASIVANIVLIPLFGWYGAALSSDICYILMGYTLLRAGNREFPIPYEARRIALISVTFLSLFILAFGLNAVNNLFFYTGMVMFLFVSLYLFCAGSFLSSREKTSLKAVFSKVRSVISTAV